MGALASKDQGGNRGIAPSFSYSSRDLPGHKTLKVRQPGQNTLNEISHRNLKEELLLKEQKAKRKRLREEDEDSDEEPMKKPKLQEIDYSLDADDSDEDSDDNDPNSDSNDEDDDSDDSSEDEDEDEIRRELAKIKAERAAAQAQKIQEKEEANEISEHERALRQNPLLWQERAAEAGSDYSLEKKWYEDVVFKNQARDQPKHQKRFINDTVRNDFHRKFLNKYVN